MRLTNFPLCKLDTVLEGVSPGVVALATVLAGIALKDGVKLAKGEISQAQFAEDIFQKSKYWLALLSFNGISLMTRKDIKGFL